MLINLTEYFEVQGKHAEIEVPYEAEKFNDGFKDYDIKSRENLKLSIVNIGVVVTITTPAGARLP